MCPVPHAGDARPMTTSHNPKNTSAFYAQAAISFGVAVFSVGVGVSYLPADPWTRAFLALGALYLVTSTFTLAKCVRDQQESGTVVSRLDEARLERLLAEFDPYHSAQAGHTPSFGSISPLTPYPGVQSMPMSQAAS
jgi:hypothetical protein